jgi:hypothetical protein
LKALLNQFVIHQSIELITDDIAEPIEEITDLIQFQTSETICFILSHEPCQYHVIDWNTFFIMLNTAESARSIAEEIKERAALKTEIITFQTFSNILFIQSQALDQFPVMIQLNTSITPLMISTAHFITATIASNTSFVV